jgi:hypothetical protein
MYLKYTFILHSNVYSILYSTRCCKLLHTLSYVTVNHEQGMWYMLIIPVLRGRLRKEDRKSKASLDYIVRPSLKEQNKDKSHTEVFKHKTHYITSYI